jgi:hypothetical protein
VQLIFSFQRFLWLSAVAGAALVVACSSGGQRNSSLPSDSRLQGANRVDSGSPHLAVEIDLTNPNPLVRYQASLMAEMAKMGKGFRRAHPADMPSWCLNPGGCIQMGSNQTLVYPILGYIGFGAPAGSTCTQVTWGATPGIINSAPTPSGTWFTISPSTTGTNACGRIDQTFITLTAPASGQNAIEYLEGGTYEICSPGCGAPTGLGAQSLYTTLGYGQPGHLLEIINADNNNLVSTPANPKYVLGAGMHLTVIESQGGTDPITNPNWLLSGSPQPISAEPTSTNGGPGGSYVTPVPNPTGSNLKLYYVAIGAARSQGVVNVQATMLATSASAQAYIGLDAPDVAVSPDGLVSKTGAIGVAGSQLSIYEVLSFGNLPAPQSTAPGITWMFTTTTPDDGAGVVDAVQLINSQAIDGYAPPSPNAVFGTCGSWDLDSASPYSAPQYTPFPIPSGRGGTWSYNDSPYMRIPSFYGGTVISMSKTDSMHTYFIYKPSVSDAIWVVLGELDWGWQATTTWTGTKSNGYFPSPSPTIINPRPNPTGYPANPIPTWSAVLTSDVPECP